MMMASPPFAAKKTWWWVFISCSQFCRLMTRCDGKESVYISRPLSPSLVVLTLSRVIQTRVFTKQNYLYLCKRLCVCVCILLRRARTTTRKRWGEEGKKWKPQKGRFFLLLFSSFFVSLSLWSIFFLLKFSSSSFWEVFFKKNQHKHFKKRHRKQRVSLAFTRIVLYIVNTIRRQTQQHFFELARERLCGI